MDDEQKNKEGNEFNAVKEAAIKKAKALPEAVFYNLDSYNVSTTDTGVTIGKKQTRSEREDDYLPQEDEYTGNEDGDVVVRSDINGESMAIDADYFPNQLSIEDIAALLQDETGEGTSKEALMVERGVDPRKISPEKLKQYLIGDREPRTGLYPDAKEQTEETKKRNEEYAATEIREYTELWDEAKEKQMSASEILKNRAAEKVKMDNEAAAAVRAKIEKIPEAPQAAPTPEVPPPPVVVVEKPITPPEEPPKGLLEKIKKFFGGR